MSDIEIIDVEQGTPEWIELRLGLPTASNFHRVLAGGEGTVRSEYLRKLAGETVSRLPREEYRGAAMDRGSEMEPELRALYEIVTGKKPTPIGFVRRKLKSGFVGASPDAFIGDNGVLEIKSASPHILIDIMQTGKVPPEHLPQTQGALLVTGREFCDLAIGYTGMPLFRRTIRRDPSYIARLEVALDAFNEELAAMVAWVRQYGKDGNQ